MYFDFGGFFVRLLLHLKMNGKEKNSELVEENLFTCSYIIGIGDLV